MVWTPVFSVNLCKVDQALLQQRAPRTPGEADVRMSSVASLRHAGQNPLREATEDIISLAEDLP